MGSAAGKLQASIAELIAGEKHFQDWVEHPSSSIVHHDAECCEQARSWFLAYARSMEIGTISHYQIKAPTWLQQLFSWGPSSWPISWCELVYKDVIDCGVFAALAREVFRAQGHEPHPAQALLAYNDVCTRHWRSLWSKAEKSSDRLFPWIGDKVVYHELCLLELPDGTAKFYDSTWGNFYLPQPRFGFGAVLAVRSGCPRLLRWGDRTIACGEWVEL